MLKGDIHTDNILYEVFAATNNFYNIHSGCWPFVFIQFLFNPLNYFNPSSYLYGVVLSFIFIFFVFSSYVFIYHLTKHIFNINNINWINLYFLLFTLLFLNTSIYSAVFYWFIGSVYAVEASFCLINLALVVRYFNVRSTCFDCAALCLFSFVSCFAFQIDVLPGLFYLAQLYFCKSEKSRKLKYWFPLIIMVIAGCLSCFAPGHIARNERYDNADIQIVTIILLALKNLFFLTKRLLFMPIFVIISIVIVAVFSHYRWNCLDYTKKALIYLMFGFISAFLVCFSVAFGYRSGHLYNGCIFNIYFVFVVFWFLFLTYFGIFLGGLISKFSRKYPKKIIGLFSILLICAMSLFWCISGFKFESINFPIAHVYLKLNNTFEEGCIYKAILNDISDDTNTDIIYDARKFNIYENTNFIINPTLVNERSNTLQYSNVIIAEYYNKGSIVFILNGQDEDMFIHGQNMLVY